MFWGRTLPFAGDEGSPCILQTFCRIRFFGLSEVSYTNAILLFEHMHEFCASEEPVRVDDHRIDDDARDSRTTHVLEEEIGEVASPHHNGDRRIAAEERKRL